MAVPDKGWSWVVAFACFFVSLVLAGIFRTSGVLFVEFISTFGVTREEASWPMVICIAVLNLVGPFCGVLGQKFGARPVVICGALIATIGVSSCYLTTSLNVITILFGGVFGIGYGFMNTVTPVILNSYFLNLKATAYGIANSGSCFGSLILPLVYEFLLSNYGLSGCFLLTGGIILHISIAGCLMRPPPWQKKFRKESKKVIPQEKRSTHFGWNKDPQNLNASIPLSERKLERTPEPLSDHHSLQQKPCDSSAGGQLSADFNKETNCEVSCMSPKFQELSESTKVNATPVSDDEGDIESKKHEAELVLCSKQSTTERLVMSDSYEKVLKQKNNRLCRNFTSCILESSDFSTFKTVLTCPMFYVIGTTNVCFYFLYHMYVVIIIDYALDIGVAQGSTKYILFIFSIGDLFGRLCFGWVTDCKLVSRARFVMVCMVLIGLNFFMFANAGSYSILLAASTLYGLLLGCTMVIFPILLADFCGDSCHAVSYGCMCFMNGFANLGRPFLIGHFRDNIGSYSSMFYLLGIMSIALSFLYLLEMCFTSKQDVQLPRTEMD